jgi:hypothetical protein
MNIGAKALQILRTVAPTVALAVGGPFGPIASAALSAVLGTPAGDDKAAEAALLTATPDQLLALKKAENDFQVQMKSLGIQEERLTFDDIASARAREIAVKDSTPTILAYMVTIGFFGALSFLLIHGTPATGGEAFLLMLGSLGTAWAGIIGYFFGSSAGSAAKTDTINRIATSTKQ